MTDLKLAVRTLLRTPFVTTVGVISLALGIGANAAIFSLFHQMLLRPLPVAESDRLVNLSAPPPKPGSTSCNNAGDCDAVFSYPMFRDLERQQTAFTGIAAHRIFGANLAYQGQTLAGSGVLVSGSYFPLLGLQPALGRLLGPGDDRAPGESDVVVLSHAYWRTRFNENPAVLNDTLIVNGRPMTIVGVAPRGFDGTTLGAQPEVFVPITLRAEMEPGFDGLENRRSYWVYLFARLKPGVSIEQARAAIDVPYKAIVNDVEAALQTGMSEQTLERFRAKAILVDEGERGQSSMHRDAGPPLTLLLAVTGLVLLIACANIANLLLARGVARAGEMAVRLSIGASRWHLVRQLLVESCLLAVVGGAAGLVVSRWTLQLMAWLLPSEMGAIVELRLHPGVLLFTAAVTLGTGVLFGLYPALHATRPDLLSALKGQAGQPSGARAARRFRTGLAVVQMALSMTLLVSAGLFVRSLLNVTRIDLGLKTDHVLAFSVAPLLNKYTPDASRQLFERLEAELAAVPGVTAVTASMVPILAGSNWGSSVMVEGFEAGPDTDRNSRFNAVGPGYFRAMGIPLMAGREFTPADTMNAPRVAIVNEQFTKKFNLGRDAVGRRMAVGRPDSELDIEIIGIVQNAKYSEVKGEVPPLFFQPYRQDERLGFLTFYVRTAIDPTELVATIPRVVAGLDPNLPVVDLRTLDEQIRENVFLDRFITAQAVAFALLATLLAAVGLYGVLAYTVAQRTREFGLRMALGAEPGTVRTMVLRQVGWMTLAGGAVGLAAAVGVGRLAGSLLYELEGHDPTVLVAAVATLVGVALGAGFLPALRASRVDPMRALRYE